jgi:CheY-like chemotaxis protein
VLLVEDDVLLRDALSGGIRDLGFDVVELGDGNELLEYFRGSASSYQSILPDVVVAEIDLPGCGGAEACAQLRRAGAQVPFILMGDPGPAKVHEAATRSGAEVVLDKPFDIEALAEAVAAATGGRPEVCP